MHAAGVDRGVWHLMAGLPYPIRLAGYGIRAPKTRVRGREVAGRVEAVGKDVTDARAGRRGVRHRRGLASPSTPAPSADKLAPKPANLTFEQAAAVAISALTALQASATAAGCGPGQKVLVIGASGGVGTFAVQIAKAFGAEVTGVCSTTKIDLVRSLGADHVIDYTREDITDAGQRYDVILDIGGNRSLTAPPARAHPAGTLVIVGGEDGRTVARRHRPLRSGRPCCPRSSARR